MKINVGVIFGGRSVEHEVSIISAVQAMEHLNKERYEIFPIYIEKDGTFRYSKSFDQVEMFKDMDLVRKYSKPVTLINKNNRYFIQSLKGFKSLLAELDIILPVVHGTTVEDGSLQGYLDTIGIPYCFSDVKSAAVGQDKVFMKQIFEANKINLTKYIWLFDSDYEQKYEDTIAKIKKLKLPLFVKPACLGSSVGITKVTDFEKIDEAITEAFKYDQKIVIEEGVENLLEANISVMGTYDNLEVSVIEEVMASEDFLTFSDKYLGNSKGKLKCAPSKGMASTKRKIPADLDQDIKEEIERLAKRAYRALNSSGLVRIDFLVDKKNKKVYVNEVNSIPGSLSFYLWDKTNKKYDVLLDEIINIAIRSYKKKNKLTYSFESNILSGYNGIKGAKGGIKK